MRVIFMGTPDFSVGTLEEIIKAGHEVVLVVSQPDKAVGRSKALKYTPVKECAIAHGIEVYQPERVRDSACIEYLISWRSTDPVGCHQRRSVYRSVHTAHGRRC